jgi:MSHA pilin protein MshB
MKKQSGFTLIELVIVVVILGFLAVTAIPKFLDLTDQAKQANIEGMAGGFATAVSLTRAQWEAEGRPTNASSQNEVDYDGVNLVLTTESTGIRPGYPTGLTDGATLGGGFDAANCIEIWENILQQPPTVSSNIADLNDPDQNIQYYVTESGDLAASTCSYYLKETLTKSAGNYVTTNINTTANFFTYQPASSTVAITINN